MALTPDQTKRLLRGVYTGAVGTHNLPRAYYKDAADNFMGHLKRGWGIKKVGVKTQYLEKFEELADNTHMFAAAKTYSITRELKAAKIGTKTYDEYKVNAEKVLNRYNAWEETEANTIQAQGQMAKMWQGFEKDVDILPYLRYSTIGKACDICFPFEGITAPVDDPIWRRIGPVNHPNCYCVLLQENELVQTSSKAAISAAMKHGEKEIPIWCQQNAGITGMVFGKEHPYYTEVLKKDLPAAKKNFNLPIPKSY